METKSSTLYDLCFFSCAFCKIQDSKSIKHGVSQSFNIKCFRLKWTRLGVKRTINDIMVYGNNRNQDQIPQKTYLWQPFPQNRGRWHPSSDLINPPSPEMYI